MSKALEDIVAERRRQVEVEGWTAEHDDKHARGEMAIAAACYALETVASDKVRESDTVPKIWPWDAEWWKPTYRRRDLVKAGALIVAEIERMDRAQMLILLILRAHHPEPVHRDALKAEFSELISRYGSVTAAVDVLARTH